MYILSQLSMSLRLDSITDSHPSLAGLIPIIKGVLAVLISVGIYRVLASLLIVFARRWRGVKRLLLGANYLDGTWIGKFQTDDSLTIYTVEHFEQDLSSLHISGRGFYQSGEIHSQWNSLPQATDDD